MAKQTIDVGTVPNDGTGDPLRDAMVKVNQNFTELYTDPFPSNTVSVGNNSVNAVINSTSFTLANTNSLISIGNSSVNAYINTTFIAIANATHTSQLKLDRIYTGNSTQNSVISGTSISVSNGTSNVTINAGNLVVSSNTLTLGSSNVGTVNFANGYSRLPNGLLMQWGTMLCNTTTGAQTFSTVTGTAFTNIFSMSAVSNSTAALLGVVALSETSFTLRANTTANVSVYWNAIGK